MLTSLYNDAI